MHCFNHAHSSWNLKHKLVIVIEGNSLSAWEHKHFLLKNWTLSSTASCSYYVSFGTSIHSFRLYYACHLPAHHPFMVCLYPVLCNAGHREKEARLPSGRASERAHPCSSIGPKGAIKVSFVDYQKMVLLAEDRQGTMTTMLSCGHWGMKEWTASNEEKGKMWQMTGEGKVIS